MTADLHSRGGDPAEDWQGPVIEECLVVIVVKILGLNKEGAQQSLFHQKIGVRLQIGHGMCVVDVE